MQKWLLGRPKPQAGLTKEQEKELLLKTSSAEGKVSMIVSAKNVTLLLSLMTIALVLGVGHLLTKLTFVEFHTDPRILVEVLNVKRTNRESRLYVVLLEGEVGQKVKVGARMINGCIHDKLAYISISNAEGNEAVSVPCDKEQSEACWTMFTLLRPGLIEFIWEHGKQGQARQIKIDLIKVTQICFPEGVGSLVPPLTCYNAQPINDEGNVYQNSCLPPSFEVPVGLGDERYRWDVIFNPGGQVGVECALISRTKDAIYATNYNVPHIFPDGHVECVPTTGKVLSPQIYEIGPYAIKNTGLQWVMFNPTWSLKRVKLSTQTNTSAIKPTCTPFLSTSYAGWLTWLHRRTLAPTKRTQRDMTGILGTGLGVLSSIDAEMLAHKLSTTTTDLYALQHPLQSSLPALGTNQWFLSYVLPQWERTNMKDH